MGRRVPLTVDLECPRCAGTGVVQWKEVAPGRPIRVGGHTTMIKRTRLCNCVTPEVQIQPEGEG